MKTQNTTRSGILRYRKWQLRQNKSKSSWINDTLIRDDKDGKKYITMTAYSILSLNEQIPGTKETSEQLFNNVADRYLKANMNDIVLLSDMIQQIMASKTKYISFIKDEKKAYFDTKFIQTHLSILRTTQKSLIAVYIDFDKKAIYLSNVYNEKAFILGIRSDNEAESTNINIVDNQIKSIQTIINY